ncbi:MAG: leucine-rich repeat domain-containing protein [Eubacterium sp.]|nr:leucine-rich repeat domain-containing protein [Eubacterium sp.]
MNKKTNKILAACLSAVMLLSASPVMAAPVIQEVGEGSAKTDVYLNIDDTNIIAGVPTTIIVDGKANENGENIGEYSVSASGDMAGNKELTIAPESNEITLTQKGKADITASISQEQTVFSSEDLANGTSSNGKVSATLTAGSWTGSTNFVISMNTLLMPGYTTLYEYDLSATTDDDVKAYYMVPNKNTSAVEVETEPVIGNMNILSTISNLVKPMTAYAADSTVIEVGETRFELSDEDKLIISGNGEMKKNIATDIADFEGLRKAVDEHFNTTHSTAHIGTDTCKVDYVKNNRQAVIQYKNYTDLYPINVMSCWKVNDGSWVCDKSCGSIMQGTGEGPFSASETSRHNNPQLMQEVNDYIDSIKNDYIISLPKEVIIRDGVTNISEKAFYNVYTIESIEIPNTVTSIGEEAFWGCKNLTDISIPDSVKYIGHFSFNSCGFVKDESNYVDGVLYVDNVLVEVKNTVSGNFTIRNNTSTIAGGAFTNCKNITSVTIPQGITTINPYTFFGCKKLGRVTIPDSVTYIDKFAFTNCSSLGYITIPDSVTGIGMSAFDHTMLRRIDIPNSVKSIGYGAFYGSSNMQTVNLPNSVESIENEAFLYIKQGSTINCQSQAVADLLIASKNYDSLKSTIVVAPELFS